MSIYDIFDTQGVKSFWKFAIFYDFFNVLKEFLWGRKDLFLNLRGDAKKETVSPYASPSRQTDYSNLPPCYTFVGEGEPFYAETLQYVEDLRSAGVPAEADVYPTNVHAFDMLYPEDAVSRQAISAFEQRFGDAIKKCETSAN